MGKLFRCSRARNYCCFSDEGAATRFGEDAKGFSLCTRRVAPGCVVCPFNGFLPLGSVGARTACMPDVGGACFANRTTGTGAGCGGNVKGRCGVLSATLAGFISKLGDKGFGCLATMGGCFSLMDRAPSDVPRDSFAGVCGLSCTRPDGFFFNVRLRAGFVVSGANCINPGNSGRVCFSFHNSSSV